MFTVLANNDRCDLSNVPHISLGVAHHQELPCIEEVSNETLQRCEGPDEEGMPSSRKNNVAEIEEKSETPLLYTDPLAEMRKDCVDIDHRSSDSVCEPRAPSMCNHGRDNNRDTAHMPATSHARPQDTEENELSKRTVLLDLQQLSKQHGVVLTKDWSMEDRLEDMLLEMRRHSLALDEQSNVNMMRDAMRLMVTGVEMINNKMGLLDLDGWSTEVCKDLNKHDANLARIYRKYWRRGVGHSPEASIALSFIGSMGMHHVKRTMSKNLMNRAKGSNFTSNGTGKYRTTSTILSPDSSDEEGPPS
jgi:hypothetical protein